MRRSTLFWQGAGALLALGACEAARAGGSAAPRTGPAGRTPSELTVARLGEGFAPLIVKGSFGRIDWTAGEIVAAARAPAGGPQQAADEAAKRAARVAAAENAVRLMQAIDPGPAGWFGDTRGLSRLTVESVLKLFGPAKLRADAKQRVAAATLRVPIHGLRSMVALRHVVLGLPLPRWQPPAGGPHATRIDAIVIDARGTGFRPCVYPRLITSDGRCLLDGIDLRRDDPSRRSRPLYVMCAATARTRKPGLESRPVGAKAREAPTHPGPRRLPPQLTFAETRKRAVVLRAASLSQRPAGLVVRDDDVRRLSRCPNCRDLLDRGEVAIICDPPSP